MANFNPNRVLHGNEGTAWFNGKKLTTLQSIEAKVAADYEDINNCGDPATYRIITVIPARARSRRSRSTRMC